MIYLFILLFSLTIHADQFKTPQEVRREFHEPGHIPQGLKPRKYRKLDDLIPAQRRKVLREEKRLQRERKKGSLRLKKQGKPISWFSLFPEAQAACVTSQVIPDPTPSPINTEESPLPLPSPTITTAVPLPLPSPISSPTPLPTVITVPTPKPTVITVIDLRPFDSYIRNQWDSTCTGHAVISIMENRLKQSGVSSTLSVRYLWSQYQALNTIKALNAAYGEPLEVDESLWPQAKSSPTAALLSLSSQGKYRITGYSYIAAVYTPAVKAELVAKRPLYIAMSVPSDLGACRATIRITSLMTSGAHAMAVVGMVEDDTLVKEGKGYLILKNSWGTACGEKGYHYLPFSFCERDDVFCEFYRVTAVK